MTARLALCLNKFVMPHQPVQAEWHKVMLDFVQGTDSLEALAARHGLKYGTVRWHSMREKWYEQRLEHQAKLTQRLNSLAVNKTAMTILRELNEKQIKLNEELRFILNSRLKERDPSGKVVPRKDLTIPDITRAVAAFSELYRLDRIALGVASDNQPPSQQRDRFTDMSDDELMSELERVRREPLIQ